MTREERQEQLEYYRACYDKVANLGAAYRLIIDHLENSLLPLPNDLPWPRGQRMT